MSELQERLLGHLDNLNSIIESKEYVRLQISELSIPKKVGAKVARFGRNIGAKLNVAGQAIKNSNAAKSVKAVGNYAKDHPLQTATAAAAGAHYANRKYQERNPYTVESAVVRLASKGIKTAAGNVSKAVKGARKAINTSKVGQAINNSGTAKALNKAGRNISQAGKTVGGAIAQDARDTARNLRHAGASVAGGALVGGLAANEFRKK